MVSLIPIPRKKQDGSSGKEVDLKSGEIMGSDSCSLGKTFNLSEPQFYHLEIGGEIQYLLIRLL